MRYGIIGEPPHRAAPEERPSLGPELAIGAGDFAQRVQHDPRKRRRVAERIVRHLRLRNPEAHREIPIGDAAIVVEIGRSLEDREVDDLSFALARRFATDPPQA